MIVTLEPKIAFQKNEVQTKAFREIVDSEHFKEGVHKAIAEFVWFKKPSAEELEGVRRFMETLLNMGEKPEPVVKSTIIDSISNYGKPQPKK